MQALVEAKVHVAECARQVCLRTECVPRWRAVRVRALVENVSRMCVRRCPSIGVMHWHIDSGGGRSRLGRSRNGDWLCLVVNRVDVGAIVASEGVVEKRVVTQGGIGEGGIDGRSS